jgi:hypothetical protein
MKKSTFKQKDIVDMELGKKEKFKRTLGKVKNDITNVVTNPKIVAVTTVAVVGAGIACYKTFK